jgi:F-type H+-transporting ATPase subunit gamma
MVVDLAKRVQGQPHPLLQSPKEVKNIAIILVTASRGLCGGYNSQIISQAINYTKAESEKNPAIKFHWLTAGKKGSEFLARNNQNLVAEFEKAEVMTSASEIMPLVKTAVADYQAGVYDKVMIAYTDYYSAMIQKPRVKQLLPLEEKMDDELGSAGENQAEKIVEDQPEYLFEPNPAEVLNRFLPHLIQVQAYQAFLEASASEQSARMMAMKNASSAASDMIAALTLAFNQARQAAITREIAEITGGKAALE